MRFSKKILIYFLLTALFFILVVNLARPIKLTVVDIGRHIINGQLMSEGQTEVLYKNFYTFTQPQYPFINHHWFFGVLAYWIWLIGGFALLSLAYILCIVLALTFVLRATFLRGNIEIAILLSFLALPLMWERNEIRPEGVSMLLMGVYYYLLTKGTLGRMNRTGLLVSFALCQIIWVNTHIFFFMGSILALTFLWDAKNQGKSHVVKLLWPIVVITLCANIINPSLLTGMLTPLNVFNGFALKLVENYNIFEAITYLTSESIYKFYLIIFGLSVGAVISAIWLKGVKSVAPWVVLFLFFLLAAINATRLIPPFGLFFIAVGSVLLAGIVECASLRIQQVLRSTFLIMSFALALYHLNIINYSQLGVGLFPKVNLSAEFFKENHLKGPIYSNYGIGGFLIYHLSSQEKLFIDNRLEAFPKDFINNVYVKSQAREDAWKELDAQNQFNVIYFKRTNLTLREDNFLKRRFVDPQWALVYSDTFVLIYLKRNELNRAIIERLEIKN